MVLFSTADYGAGVAGDGVVYLSAADNLVAGKGFFDSAKKNAKAIVFLIDSPKKQRPRENVRA